jgi:hypothetical protein
MRIVVVLLSLIFIAGAVLKLRQPESVGGSTSEAASSPQPREAHWPKQSLNRAAELKQQVAAQRKSDQVP